MPSESTNKKEDDKYDQRKVKGSIWSKLTEERGNELKARSVSNIGPGEYEARVAEKHDVPSSAFRS